MAKLYFYYSAMNAGKSTVLLQSAYNYNERGMDTILFSPALDVRFGKDKIASRIGLTAPAVTFTDETNLQEYVAKALAENSNIKCVLVDEAQFLSRAQVQQLSNIVDELTIPVLAYGIRSDFRGEPFAGSLQLLILADNIIEIKTICFCGRKATMNSRIDAEGKAVRVGEQLLIGGNESYIATCRRHFKGMP